MIRTYADALWQAQLRSTIRLRWVARRARRLAGQGRLDSAGHVRWAAVRAVLRDRDARR